VNRSRATSDLGIRDAARAGLIDRVQALLAKGTPIDESDETGRTALHHAVMGGQTDVVRLMAMERENPFVLAGCGHDFLDGRFVSGVKNAERLAERMIAFCPDIVEQATASLSRRSRPDQIVALAQQLSESGWFGFWWD
jgi:ankyrin repeat protein